MQSPRMSLIESGVSTLITGTVATVLNYTLLYRVWTLPPTILGSVGMAFVFGGVSWLLKFFIRRLFNAIR